MGNLNRSHWHQLCPPPTHPTYHPKLMSCQFFGRRWFQQVRSPHGNHSHLIPRLPKGPIMAWGRPFFYLPDGVAMNFKQKKSKSFRYILRKIRMGYRCPLVLNNIGPKTKQLALLWNNNRSDVDQYHLLWINTTRGGLLLFHNRAVGHLYGLLLFHNRAVGHLYGLLLFHNRAVGHLYGLLLFHNRAVGHLCGLLLFNNRMPPQAKTESALERPCSRLLPPYSWEWNHAHEISHILWRCLGFWHFPLARDQCLNGKLGLARERSIFHFHNDHRILEGMNLGQGLVALPLNEDPQLEATLSCQLLRAELTQGIECPHPQKI